MSNPGPNSQTTPNYQDALWSDNTGTALVQPSGALYTLPVAPSFSAGNYTWATKPSAASVPVGTVITITDIPTGGRTQFYSNGTGWCTDGYKILAGSAVASSTFTGTLTPTTMVTTTIPGGLLGTNGLLEGSFRITTSNSANSKTSKFFYGATQMLTVGGTAITYLGARLRMANRNSQASQIGTPVNLSTTDTQGQNAQSTATEDSSADKALIIQFTLGNVAETMVLESWEVLFCSRW